MGVHYWAHFRLGRLNGLKFYCVQDQLRLESVRFGRECVATFSFKQPQHMANWIRFWRRYASHKLVIYMATFLARFSPFLQDFRHFLVSARRKLGIGVAWR